jgi:hypothetical protein
MMAIHHPKHVFIIEKGDSFGLFVDHSDLIKSSCDKGFSFGSNNFKPKALKIELTFLSVSFNWF